MEITIIVTTYNGMLDAILATINSIVKQKKIKVRLIITDDGSNHFFRKEIEDFLDHNNFSNYQIIEHKKNVGTVLNVYDALKQVNTKYVKLISQGDLLYCDSSLHDMVQFMEHSDYKIAFGKIAGYTPLNNNEIVEYFSPQDISAYVTNDNSIITKEFIYYLNGPCGACHMYQTEVLRNYLSKIAGRVIFCEDNIIAMLLLDGEAIGYFDSFFIWYEVGTGISSSNNKTTSKMMRNDQYRFFSYLKEAYNNSMTRKALRLYSVNRLENNILRKIVKILVHPDLIRFRIKVKTNLSFTRKKLAIENADKDILIKYLTTNEYKE